MPGVLAEVGSMSLEAESDLLASPSGQDTVAEGLFDAVEAFLAQRDWGVRYDASFEGGGAGAAPPEVAGVGPPFAAPEIAAASDGSFAFELRLTNTGNRPWPEETTLRAGWEETEEPYLAQPPANLEELALAVPALRPGESVVLAIHLDAPRTDGRQVAWISLSGLTGDFAEAGSPALQVAVP